MQKKQVLKEEFQQIVDEIICHTEYQKLKLTRHHDDSVYEHCMEVAKVTYLIAKKLHLDYYSATRGALLHDFFLYDWRSKEGREIKHFFQKHGFTHPQVAFENSVKHFKINEIEKDIIRKHMFPLTIAPPRYPESWLVTFVDKFNALSEYWIRLCRAFNV